MYSLVSQLHPFIEAVKGALLVEHPMTRKTPPDIGVLPPLPYRDESDVSMNRPLGAVRMGGEGRGD